MHGASSTQPLEWSKGHASKSLGTPQSHCPGGPCRVPSAPALTCLLRRSPPTHPAQGAPSEHNCRKNKVLSRGCCKGPILTQRRYSYPPNPHRAFSNSGAGPLPQHSSTTQYCLTPLYCGFGKAPPVPASAGRREGETKGLLPSPASPTSSIFLTPSVPCPEPRGLAKLQPLLLETPPPQWTMLPFQGLPPPLGPQVKNLQPVATRKVKIVRLEAQTKSGVNKKLFHLRMG